MSGLLISWTERHPDHQWVDVLEETEKAFKIRNRDFGHVAWIPKAGLKQYVPSGYVKREIDPQEKVVAGWFRERCTHQQMKALGFAE